MSSVAIPVRSFDPPPGGNGTSFRFGVNTEGSPEEPMTSHLSLQYAYLTPDPAITLARKSPEHTPVVCCVQVLSQLPDGSQFDLGVPDEARNDWQFEAEYWVAPCITYVPVTPLTVGGPWQVMYVSLQDGGPQ